jgi:hypothetical protein
VRRAQMDLRHRRMGPARGFSADASEEPPRSPLATGEPMNDGVLGLATGVALRGVLPSAFLRTVPTEKVAVRMETTVAAKPRERHLTRVNGICLIHGPPSFPGSCPTANLTSKVGGRAPRSEGDGRSSRRRARCACSLFTYRCFPSGCTCSPRGSTIAAAGANVPSDWPFRSSASKAPRPLPLAPLALVTAVRMRREHISARARAHAAVFITGASSSRNDAKGWIPPADASIQLVFGWMVRERRSVTPPVTPGQPLGGSVPRAHRRGFQGCQVLTPAVRGEVRIAHRHGDGRVPHPLLNLADGCRPVRKLDRPRYAASRR